MLSFHPTGGGRGGGGGEAPFPAPPGCVRRARHSAVEAADALSPFAGALLLCIALLQPPFSPYTHSYLDLFCLRFRQHSSGTDCSGKKARKPQPLRTEPSGFSSVVSMLTSPLNLPQVCLLLAVAAVERAAAAADAVVRERLAAAWADGALDRRVEMGTDRAEELGLISGLISGCACVALLSERERERKTAAGAVMSGGKRIGVRDAKACCAVGALASSHSRCIRIRIRVRSRAAWRPQPTPETRGLSAPSYPRIRIPTDTGLRRLRRRQRSGCNSHTPEPTAVARVAQQAACPRPYGSGRSTRAPRPWGWRRFETGPPQLR